MWCGSAKPSSLPMEQQHCLSVDTGELMEDPTKYSRLIGSFIYLTITRPRLCYSSHISSQFMHNPWKPHWDAVLRVVRYLKQNSGQRIFLQRPSPLYLTAYYDSKCDSYPMTQHSVTRYFVMLGGCPVS